MIMLWQVQFYAVKGVFKSYSQNRGVKVVRYGYARVSTKGQASQGNSIDEQVNALKKAGCEEIVSETYSGTSLDRPEFDKLINRLQQGDILTVTKLDRFARTAASGSMLIKDLLYKGVAVHILNMGIIDNSPIGRVIVNVLLAFAEFERDMIVERTQAGKAIARMKPGFTEGRPPIPQAQKELAVRLITEEHHSYNQVAQETGISKATLVRAVRKYKINSNQD